MARRSSITRDSVVDAALEIIDSAGVTGLNLDAIAARLGARGPSLYYHFASKDEILDAVTERVIGNLGVRHDAENWSDWLVDRALLFQTRVLEHPGAAPLLMEHLNPRAAEIGFARGARMLAEAGVPVELHDALLRGVQHLAWGASLYGAYTVTRPPHPPTDEHEFPELLAARTSDPHRDDLAGALERAVRGFIAGLLAEYAVAPDASDPEEDSQ